MDTVANFVNIHEVSLAMSRFITWFLFTNATLLTIVEMVGSDSPSTNPYKIREFSGCIEIQKKKYHDRLQTYHN